MSKTADARVLRDAARALEDCASDLYITASEDDDRRRARKVNRRADALRRHAARLRALEPGVEPAVDRERLRAALAACDLDDICSKWNGRGFDALVDVVLQGLVRAP